jgi:hypothetical protein
VPCLLRLSFVCVCVCVSAQQDRSITHYSVKRCGHTSITQSVHVSTCSVLFGNPTDEDFDTRNLSCARLSCNRVCVCARTCAHVCVCVCVRLAFARCLFVASMCVCVCVCVSTRQRGDSVLCTSCLGLLHVNAAFVLSTWSQHGTGELWGDFSLSHLLPYILTFIQSAFKNSFSV